MLIRKLILVGLLGVAGWAWAQDETVLPFHLPTPDGWRTEIIPIPLDFAPELKYEGIEELPWSGVRAF